MQNPKPHSKLIFASLLLATVRSVNAQTSDENDQAPLPPLPATSTLSPPFEPAIDRKYDVADVLENSIAIASDGEQPDWSRLNAIRTLSAFAGVQTAIGPNARISPQALVVEARHVNEASIALQRLLADPNPSIAEGAFLNLSNALRFELDEGDAAKIKVSDRNRETAEFLVGSMPSIVLSCQHSDLTRRRAVEKLSQAADALRVFYAADKAAAVREANEATEARLLGTVQRMNALIGSLFLIQEQCFYAAGEHNVPGFATVAVHLLNALIADQPLRAASAPPGGAGGQGNGAQTPVAAVDSSLQPIAATSLPTATSAASLPPASKLLGAATTGTYTKNRTAGRRPHLEEGQTAPVPQARRAGQRAPGVRLPETLDADRLNRSRGASGSSGATVVPGPVAATPPAPPSGT